MNPHLCFNVEPKCPPPRVMVDWLSASFVSMPHTYDTGRFLVIGPGGTVEKEFSGHVIASDLDEDNPEPSHSRKWKVAAADPTGLFISGNPAPLLNPQGHNLWGSPDLWGQTLLAGQFIRAKEGLFPSEWTWGACGFELKRYTRVDLTRSYRFPSEAEALAWIQHVAAASKSRHGAASLRGGSTAYFGSGSNRWRFKVYAKRNEYLRNHCGAAARHLASAGLLRDDLADWCAGVVRFELTLCSLELQNLHRRDIGGRGRGHLPALHDPAYLADTWAHYHDRIEWNQAMSHRQPEIFTQALSGPQRMLFAMWQEGKTWQRMQEFFPSRMTLWRHRKAIQAATGVDIAHPRPQETAPDVSAGLDPAGWDPEPLEAVVEPPPELKAQFPLYDPRWHRHDN